MSLKFALLGFLVEQPMTGYDLRKAMEASVGHFWTADQAQIYRTLSGLVDEGLVTVDVVEQETRPNRRVHRICPAGEDALDAWLASPLEPVPVREPFLMRTFFGGRLKVEAIEHLLTARIDEATQLVSLLSAIRQQQSTPTSLSMHLRIATLDNGIAHGQAEIDWAKTVLNGLGAWHGTDLT
ncbi:PadR family transcriptional regulator [Celeribacter arenosi]|uniref:PadR family transcriptional regulator n=1 Tax=Celeribacter arenosi TaxID=792649 RepID=A0ABP7KFN5_9RHOB